jgi:hypothetical protein
LDLLIRAACRAIALIHTVNLRLSCLRALTKVPASRPLRGGRTIAIVSRLGGLR